MGQCDLLVLFGSEWSIIYILAQLIAFKKTGEIFETTLTPLSAVSPADGRYHKATSALTDYFFEGALIKYRVRVEIEYFIALCELPLSVLQDIDPAVYEKLRRIYLTFSQEDAQKIKDIEKVTNHDVKAVEYFIKEKFESLKLGAFREFIHFGLTSQDINNTAVPFSLKEAWQAFMQPATSPVNHKRGKGDFSLPIFL